MTITLSNFRDYRKVVLNPVQYREYATVDVTTRRWFRTRTVAREIAKDAFLYYWYFTDTGEFTPESGGGAAVPRVPSSHGAFLVNSRKVVFSFLRRES